MHDVTIDRRRLMTSGLRLALAWPVAAAALACGEGGQEKTGGMGDSGGAAPPKPAPSPAAEAPPPPPAAPSAESGGGSGAAMGDAAPVVDIPDNASLVTALSYTEQSDKPDQHCANCLFFTAGAGGRGKCQLFAKGTVKSTGWCTSWSLRP